MSVFSDFFREAAPFCRAFAFAFFSLALAVVLAVILFFMFGPGKAADTKVQEKSLYKPGVYTSSITLNDNSFDVEVTVNADRIKSIRLVNLIQTADLSGCGNSIIFMERSS